MGSLRVLAEEGRAVVDTFDINDRATWVWTEKVNDFSGEPDGAYRINPSDRHAFYQVSNGRPALHQCAMGTDTSRLVFNPMLEVCNWPRNVDEAEVYAWAVSKGSVTDHR